MDLPSPVIDTPSMIHSHGQVSSLSLCLICGELGKTLLCTAASLLNTNPALHCFSLKSNETHLPCQLLGLRLKDDTGKGMNVISIAVLVKTPRRTITVAYTH